MLTNVLMIVVFTFFAVCAAFALILCAIVGTRTTNTRRVPAEPITSAMDDLCACFVTAARPL